MHHWHRLPCPLIDQVTLAGSDFNTLLAVYTGTVVSSLTRVAFNDDCAPEETTSCATFSVVPGTSYSIQVDGGRGSRGAVRIAVTSTPLNDAFSAAERARTFTTTGTTLGATLQPGEPALGSGASGSVWYWFTIPVDSGTAAASATVRPRISTREQ